MVSYSLAAFKEGITDWSEGKKKTDDGDKWSKTLNW